MTKPLDEDDETVQDRRLDPAWSTVTKQPEAAVDEDATVDIDLSPTESMDLRSVVSDATQQVPRRLPAHSIPTSIEGSPVAVDRFVVDDD